MERGEIVSALLRYSLPPSSPRPFTSEKKRVYWTMKLDIVDRKKQLRAGDEVGVMEDVPYAQILNIKFISPAQRYPRVNLLLTLQLRYFISTSSFLLCLQFQVTHKRRNWRGNYFKAVRLLRVKISIQDFLNPLHVYPSTTMLSMYRKHHRDASRQMTLPSYRAHDSDQTRPALLRCNNCPQRKNAKSQRSQLSGRRVANPPQPPRESAEMYARPRSASSPEDARPARTLNFHRN